MEAQDDEDRDGKLALLEKNLRLLKSKLTCPFTDIEASYMVLFLDLSKMRDRVKNMMSGLGSNYSHPQVTVWTSLCNLHSGMDFCK